MGCCSSDQSNEGEDQSLVKNEQGPPVTTRPSQQAAATSTAPSPPSGSGSAVAAPAPLPSEQDKLVTIVTEAEKKFISISTAQPQVISAREAQSKSKVTLCCCYSSYMPEEICH